MEKPREILISAFSDGKSPTGSQFKLLIDSILSRRDDGLDKTADSPLKVMAGSMVGAPVIALCPKDVLDPQWVVSLKALDIEGKVIGEGLNIGQGDKPANPVVYLDKATGHVGLGTNLPSGALEVMEATNGETALVVNNPSEANGAYSIARLRTLGGDGVIFKNSDLRTNDGGANAMTVRNDVGDLRLQATALKTGITLKASTGYVGVNTATPNLPLDVNGNMTLNGNSLYFPGNPGTVETAGSPGLFWHGINNGASANTYGIYRTPGAWTGNFQQLKIAFDTGIQLAAGTGVNAGFGKSYVEVVSGKGLMVSSGNLGVGTVNSAAKAHVVTTAFDGDQPLLPAWNAGQVVVGADATAGGVGIAYSVAKETGYLLSAAPGAGYKDLMVKARTTFFSNGTAETMRITTDGRLGIGTGATAPAGVLHVRKDGDGNNGIYVTNANAGVNAHVVAGFQTDGSTGWIFKNSSTRNSDGLANTMTVRNDKGDLRLQAEGQVGMQIKATSGFVGIGSTNALAPITIGTATNAKENNPDGQMHITNSCIMFGGPNTTGREQSSAQISAGKHQANSLNIIGMASGNSAADRRIDIWADGGLYFRAGNLGVGASGGAVVAPVTISSDGKWWDPDGSLRLTNGAIQFGGLNGTTREGNSAQISAGKHQADSLNIIGMSDANKANRRVDMWAEGGFMLRGKMGIETLNPATRFHLASNGKAINGNGMLLGNLSDKIKDSTVPGEELGSIEIAFAGWRDNEPNQIGAKIASIRIANYPAPSAHAIQASELAFYTGGGASSQIDNVLHETCAERLRIKKDGSVGIGTKTPASFLGVAGNLTIGVNRASTTAAPANGLHVEGDTQLNGGLHAMTGIRVGTANVGTAFSMELQAGTASPIGARLLYGADNTGWRFAVAKKVGALITDQLVVVDTGNVGIGTTDPNSPLEVRRDVDSGTYITVANASAGANAHAVTAYRTDNGFGYVYKSGSGRTADGGANTMTVLNENGDLRLHAGSKVGMQVKATTGNVAFGGTVARAPITVANDGEWSSPDGTMRITKSAILFGGSNDASREGNSCQISAGHHVANSLCIVGMSDTNKANRKVDMWAEGGFTLRGTMRVNDKAPFSFKRFQVNQDGPHVNTGYAYSDYIVAVVGFFSYGDRATNGFRVMPTEPSPGRADWRIVCDLHGPFDYTWELMVMAVRREFTEFL